MTNVVHVREKYDVYIGRGKCPKTGEPGKWGNPFIIGRDGSRDEVVEKHRAQLMLPANWRSRNMIRRELGGKTLGCWCSPLSCHGDTLAQIADSPVE